MNRAKQRGARRALVGAALAAVASLAAPAAYAAAVTATTSGATDAPLTRPGFLTSDAKGLAAASADVNARLADGSTALQWAVYNGDLAEVQRLIKAGADVKAVNRYGASAMSIAAVASETQIVRALLKAGADAESPNAEGQTALMAAARTGNLEVARLLLKAGAKVNTRESWGEQTALMWAAAAQQPDMLRLLLKRGAQPDLKSTVRDWPRKVTAEPREKSMDQGGFAALHYAAREGCIPCIKVLVDGGADIDLPDGQGTTPLILALMNLHFDTAMALIDAGADIHVWDFQGQTPLYAAVDTNTVPQGARPDVASTDTLTGLDLMRVLIDRGANVNAQLKLRLPGRAMPGDRNADFRVLTTGATPLMRAAVACDLPAMDMLIKAGAKVDMPIVDGSTPLFGTIIAASARARFKTEPQVLAAMRALKAAGADPRRAVGQSTRVMHLIHIHTPDHARVPGSTALMMAAVRGWQEVAKQLVEWGVDIHAKDADGLTALDYAMGRERYGFLQVKPSPNLPMAELLRKLGATVEMPNAAPWPPLSVPQIRAIVPELLYFDHG
jgi:uncharacterized protein